MKALWEHQRKLTLNDSQLAERLGVVPSLISMVKSGERRFTPELAQLVLKAFPELGFDVMAWLREDTNKKGEAPDE